MAKDAKWYAGWVRNAYAQTAEEKLTNLEAADFIEFLAAELEAVKREKDTAVTDGSEKGNEWISVNEKLPEKLVTVLVCSEFDRLLCYHDGRNWIATYDNEYVDGDYEITHWMPIPDWPK